jgi:hypothetical protein
MRMNRDNAYGSNFDSTGTVFDSTWHRVAFTTDGTNLAWYIDGRSDSTSTLLSYTNNSLAQRMMAQLNGGSGRASVGTFDDCKIIQRCLTASEIAQEYDESRMGYPRLLNYIVRPLLGTAAAPSGGFRSRIAGGFVIAG